MGQWYGHANATPLMTLDCCQPCRNERGQGHRSWGTLGTCFLEIHTSESKRGQQLFPRKHHHHTKQIMKADGWACSHLSPWGCPPAKWHTGAAVSCILWTLKMIQGEVDCGAPAPWQEVKARMSCSSLSSPLTLWNVEDPLVQGYSALRNGSLTVHYRTSLRQSGHQVTPSQETHMLRSAQYSHSQCNTVAFSTARR